MAKIAELETELQQKSRESLDSPSPSHTSAPRQLGSTPVAVESPGPPTRVPQLQRQSEQVSAESDSELQQTVRSLVPRSPEMQNGLTATTSNDTAVILEFLAWGRRKDQGLRPASSLLNSLQNSSIRSQASTCFPIALGQAMTSPQLELLDMLFPEAKHLNLLVDFHHKRLVWYHGSYNVMTFEKDFEQFNKHCNGSVQHRDIDYQWLALLFAILTGSITCCTSYVAKEWGFSDNERQSLAKQWYQATIICLNLGQYLENHSIFAVQAIATLTVSAHTIGMSNTQSILLSSANRIAQALGLHRLAVEDIRTTGVEQDASDLMQRETGRRIWIQLCMQDWFNIPFSESCTINPKQCTTGKPLNLNDGQSIPSPSEVPTMTSYCIYHFDFALVIAELQDAMASCNTEYTRYEQVLAHDEKMRQLATAYMPTFLSNSAIDSPEWPDYVPWARRGLAICAAHKIIMIHRRFLHKSFQSTTYSFTRRTCIAASKTILKEAALPMDRLGPVLWIDQAFVVTAGVILALDAFYRKPTEPERAENARLVKDAIIFLQSHKLSTIANRGRTLLQLLLNELESPENEQGLAITQTQNPKRKRPSNATNARQSKCSKGATGRALEPAEEDLTFTSSYLDHSVYDGEFDDWANLMLPPDTGFGGMPLFGNFHRDFAL